MADQGQEQWVQCWKCGNWRWPQEPWCSTCRAPIYAGPGHHQTFGGWIFVPHPPPVLLTPAQEVARARQRRTNRRIVVGLGIGMAVGVVAIGAFGSLSPSSDKGPRLTTAQYQEIRSYCEAVATVELPPQYTVGGPHWVDNVNSCMQDRADAILP